MRMLSSRMIKSLWPIRRWRRRALALHLIVMRLKLRFLLCGQDARNLRHHLRMRDFQFDVNLRACLGSSADRGFVKGSAHRIRFVLMQSPSLIESSFVAFAKTY